MKTKRQNGKRVGKKKNHGGFRKGRKEIDSQNIFMGTRKLLTRHQSPVTRHQLIKKTCQAEAQQVNPISNLNRLMTRLICLLLKT